jgi:hypothetical protein
LDPVLRTVLRTVALTVLHTVALTRALGTIELGYGWRRIGVARRSLRPHGRLAEIVGREIAQFLVVCGRGALANGTPQRMAQLRGAGS